uniref:HDC02527 n=1 Tax=Drosophila melanogaster TaxID=7227 RepID=Q6IHI7_DROME|nr:TPA_inf: HDC02527 [Drosophila melanogaster]
MNANKQSSQDSQASGDPIIKASSRCHSQLRSSRSEGRAEKANKRTPRFLPSIFSYRLIAPRYSSYSSCQPAARISFLCPIVLRLLGLPVSVSVASCQPAWDSLSVTWLPAVQRSTKSNQSAAKQPTTHCQLNVESYSHFK